ncbi:transglycosylase domain-containing protein [Kitasatospora sp. GP82]|uniref:transglycosylase domain-containing protein n=1 Tax=Kitasatospora sp. GP82 TaxID=3035089 RepID=UPI0024760BB7|nr:transglycosylase domain-containing protein [Kitasatospora sp. GP82]MDH6123508.1 membrane peptidoglycan carboxypeptidase [Kitasatospora sp. GP82]
MRAHPGGGAEEEIPGGASAAAADGPAGPAAAPDALAEPRRRRRRRLRPDYPRRGRRGVRRWLPSWRQLVVVLLTGVAALTGFVGWFYLTTDVPDDLNAFATQQNNVYYWADGTEMARIGETNRQEVPLDRVPDAVQWAVLSAENATFYSDPGVSVSGIARAVYNMSTGGDTQGGSTITQQYVKNIYLNQQQDVSRKLSEIVIAVKLDRQMSKQDILDGYLNTSWFGRGSYGIERASEAYYGKDVSALNPSEGAFLAALLKGAGQFDPALSAENRQRAVERWSWILNRMVKNGKLSAAERAKYTVFPEPKAPPKAAGLGGQVGYLVDMARTYVESHTNITAAQFDLGGHQIYTTFEKPKVAALTAAVQDATKNLDPEHRPVDQHVRVGAASVAPDGRILAVYGGPDYLKQGFNNANTSNVPVGSAFMPFVYAAGLDQGVQRQRDGGRTQVLPTTTYNGNDGANVMTPEGPYWGRDGKIVKSANDGKKDWGPVSLRTSVEQSVNGPMMQLGMDVGLDRVRKTAGDLGLLPDSMGELVPAFALGNSTPSAVRTADAYAAFGAGGHHTDPYSVLRITRNGDPIALSLPSSVQVLSPKVAGQVDDALKGAVRNGSARAAGAAGSEVAGKTGTTPDRTAGWFVGYDGQSSTAVAVFRMDPKDLKLLPLEGVGGADSATPDSALPTGIWTAYTKSVGKGR